MRFAKVCVRMGVLVLAGSCLSAQAFAKVPTGEFAPFSQCPRTTAGVELCLYSQTTSGQVIIGSQMVPLTNPLTIQGGVTEAGTEHEVFVGALNGVTLSKVAQSIPGGLSGLVKCGELSFVARGSCESAFAGRDTSVAGMVELVHPAGEIGISTNNFVNQHGVALSIPVRLRLINPFLGNECYIGSSARPIVFDLTTGITSPPSPNLPLRGRVGEMTVKANFELIEDPKNLLVDNAFSVPRATGCGGVYAPVIDPIIDSRIGLPSASGHNAVIMSGTLEEATSEGVIASEK